MRRGGLLAGSPFSLELGAIPAMDAHQTQSVQLELTQRAASRQGQGDGSDRVV